MKNNKYKKGISIIEVIIAVAIVAIISTVIIDIYLKNTRNYKIQQSQSQLQFRARYSLDTISSWIKKSSSAISVYTAPGDSNYQSAANQLVLQIPAINENEEIIPDVFDYIIIKTDSTNPKKLMQIVYANTQSARKNSNREIANNLESIQFTYYNSTGNAITSNYENSVFIKTNIILSEVTSGKTNKVELNTKTKLRNK